MRRLCAHQVAPVQCFFCSAEQAVSKLTRAEAERSMLRGDALVTPAKPAGLSRHAVLRCFLRGDDVGAPGMLTVRPRQRAASSKSNAKSAHLACKEWI
jgi:hypothetical protein